MEPDVFVEVVLDVVVFDVPAVFVFVGVVLVVLEVVVVVFVAVLLVVSDDAQAAAVTSRATVKAPIKTLFFIYCPLLCFQLK